ncbi:hypothetical protein ACEZDB_03190 [Streptacidiphilus sp. N1-3]|uniref:Uncharacterized protein n=1 Tax=Streptacidiphilus alkalitolerans TaxID=3342712 RepID=A0ABV6WV79_9ACTN
MSRSRPPGWIWTLADGRPGHTSALLGLNANTFTPEIAANTSRCAPSQPLAPRPRGTRYVAAADLDRYATAAAERADTTAATVTEHRDWPQLAAAHQAGHDTNLLLDTAHARTTRSDNPLHNLATRTSELAAQRGIPASEHRVPAALRHQAAEQARTEAAWPALTTALRRAETAGHRPDQLLRQAVEATPMDSEDSVSLPLA